NVNLDSSLTTYPAAFDTDNIISVAAIDPWGKKAGFSNYGVRTVDLGAPGVEILSTAPSSPTSGYDSEDMYLSISGTSMATPHVAGALALLHAVNPNLSIHQQKQLLLASAVPNENLVGRTLTGRELNVGRLIANSGRRVLLLGVDIDDDDIGASHGNNDGIVNPGETIEFRLRLVNTSEEALSRLSIQMGVGTSPESITILKDTVTIQNIQPSSTFTTTESFVVRVDPNSPTPLHKSLLFAFAEQSFPQWIDEESLDVYRTAVVRGRVSLDGKPYSHVAVDYSGFQSGTIQTDTNGDFKLSLIEGEYVFKAHKNAYNESAPLQIQVGSDTPSVDFAYSVVAQGKITDFITEGPVSSAVLRLSGSHLGTFSASGDGNYQVILPQGEGIAAALWAAKPGSYYPSSPQQVEWSSGAPVVADFVLTPGGYRIRHLETSGNLNRATPVDVNNHGVVVGIEQVVRENGEVQFVAAQWDADSTLHYFPWPTPGTGHTGAYGINDQGEVVGQINDFSAQPKPFYSSTN
ncbi:MAG: S8 family serine peptidase, partial [Bdellovibrionales bacterium]|nr:S8 family serine peptidase [Bdellovibrionales bacterium]